MLSLLCAHMEPHRRENLLTSEENKKTCGGDTGLTRLYYNDVRSKSYCIAQGHQKTDVIQLTEIICLIRSQNRKPEPKKQILRPQHSSQEWTYPSFKSQYSDMDLEKADEGRFHDEPKDLDDQYQTTKEDWIYNKQGLVLIPEQLMRRVITYLHQGTHYGVTYPITGYNLLLVHKHTGPTKR